MNPKDKIKQKHEASIKKYPYLNLGSEEYVLHVVKKHIGNKIKTLAVAGLVTVLTILFLLAYLIFFGKDFASPDYLLIFFSGISIIALALIFASMSLSVNKNNRFFLTNKSIIQQIQLNPFSKNQKTVGLGNVEDISFKEEGFAATLFGFGSIQVISDEGKDTIYNFNNVANPRTEMRILNNAVEAYKEGREVTGE